MKIKKKPKQSTHVHVPLTKHLSSGFYFKYNKIK